MNTDERIDEWSSCIETPVIRTGHSGGKRDEQGVSTMRDWSTMPAYRRPVGKRIDPGLVIDCRWTETVRQMWMIRVEMRMSREWGEQYIDESTTPAYQRPIEERIDPGIVAPPLCVAALMSEEG